MWNQYGVESILHDSLYIDAFLIQNMDIKMRLIDDACDLLDTHRFQQGFCILVIHKQLLVIIKSPQDKALKVFFLGEEVLLCWKLKDGVHQLIEPSQVLMLFKNGSFVFIFEY